MNVPINCFKPQLILDIATLTDAVKQAFGDSVAGAFVNDDAIWKMLQTASYESGDRVWRLPLFKDYLNRLSKSSGYDIINSIEDFRGGKACVAAAFLSEFVQKNIQWAHIDIAGVKFNSADQMYTNMSRDGVISGRPVRLLVQLVKIISAKSSGKD